MQPTTTRLGHPPQLDTTTEHQEQLQFSKTCLFSYKHTLIHQIHLHNISFIVQTILNKSNKQVRKLRFGLGALQKITQNGRT